MSKKIVNFNDFRKKEEEEEHGQEYYTGGVDNRGGGSGLNVVDPSNPEGRRGGVFDSILERAANDTRELSHSDSNASTAHTITLYRDGFVLDNGPFRGVSDPENMKFLQKLMKGSIPPELQNEDGSVVDIQLIDKHTEEYVLPSYIAFSGQANVISTSSAQGFSISSLPQAPTLTSEPSILTQVKTPDGKKLKIKVNNTRTVREYLAYILAQAKANGSKVPDDGTISISSGFPPKELTDGEMNVVEAGLSGSSVTYKFL